MKFFKQKATKILVQRHAIKFFSMKEEDSSTMISVLKIYQELTTYYDKESELFFVIVKNSKCVVPQKDPNLKFSRMLNK